ncbi:hypothetical protein HJC23_006720 [Cyclotella cryptica]|uniref:Methyltransferase domain-containing protein n=1 Tax=Cyclotella cryptica TaxID=29204 RepID=A0ABD3PPP0_9STRA|eukprot:CCRYP_012714-RA/>CCRYP_012714-RA protein AED:0.00 eAED:0.00 QI:54/-1/1/1/-1/1/1/198/432
MNLMASNDEAMVRNVLRVNRKVALQQLHDAAQLGDIVSVQAIFEGHNELSVNETRKGKNTILHTALFHNQEGILLDYLIQKGADVNCANSKGLTPLVVAIIYCKEGKAIEKLTAAGAIYDLAIETGSFQGMFLLDVAKKYKNENAISRLKYLFDRKDAEKDVLLKDKVPRGRAICPICNQSVRYPTQMSRILDHQADVEKNFELYGEYGGKKKKQKIYTSRKYLDQFLSHSNGEAYRKLCRIEFHATENMSLRKEISESYAVIEAVQKCCAKLSNLPEQVGGTFELRNIFLIDLCSGKGITSALGAALYPERNFFLSIDKMLPHTVPHHFFNDEQHVSYISRDILCEEVFHELEKLVHQQTYVEGRTAILVGMHLCGVLSERAIDFFERISAIRGIVLSPCCLPKKHELKTLHFNPAHKEKGCDPYPNGAII